MTNHHVESSIEPSNIRSNPVKKFDSNRIELYVIRFDGNSIEFDNSIGALAAASPPSAPSAFFLKNLRRLMAGRMEIQGMCDVMRSYACKWFAVEYG
jgi:hypothetical protein